MSVGVPGRGDDDSGSTRAGVCGDDRALPTPGRATPSRAMPSHPPHVTNIVRSALNRRGDALLVSCDCRARATDAVSVLVVVVGELDGEHVDDRGVDQPGARAGCSGDRHVVSPSHSALWNRPPRSRMTARDVTRLLRTREPRRRDVARAWATEWSARVDGDVLCPTGWLPLTGLPLPLPLALPPLLLLLRLLLLLSPPLLLRLL